MRSLSRVTATVCLATLVLSACGGGDEPSDEVVASEPTEVGQEPSEPLPEEPDAEPSPSEDPDAEPAPADEPGAEPSDQPTDEPGAGEEPTPASDPCDGRDPQSLTTDVGDFFFEPADRSDLCVGDRITFVNDGGISHTATNRDGAFDTGTLGAGESATVTVEQTGQISYVCLFHGQMSGTLTVVG